MRGNEPCSTYARSKGRLKRDMVTYNVVKQAPQQAYITKRSLFPNITYSRSLFLGFTMIGAMPKFMAPNLGRNHVLKDRRLSLPPSLPLFTAWCANRGLPIACSLSVRPSVCLSVCNVGGSHRLDANPRSWSGVFNLLKFDLTPKKKKKKNSWKSWKLIARKISPTPSLFAVQRSST